jgi:hypothetical protein
MVEELAERGTCRAAITALQENRLSLDVYKRVIEEGTKRALARQTNFKEEGES